MVKYYSKHKSLNIRIIIRSISLGVSLCGLLSLMYFALPLLSWQLYLAPAFASQNLALPIPKTTVISGPSITSLVQSTASVISGTDYSDASNWFPSYKDVNIVTTQTTYLLSIPKINVYNAVVSTADTNLNIHLVHYGGTPLPPNNGNAIIFGHSTLPQLFDPKNYKTIFANAHLLQVGDTVTATINGVGYEYKIYQIVIIDPEDTSMLAQDFSDSFITLVTCTPPGTTWKRLVIRARLEKL